MTRKLNGDHCVCADGIYGGCGKYFNSTAAFDKHRIGDWPDRRCRTEAEMLEAGMVISATGWWLPRKNAPHPSSLVARTGDRQKPMGEVGVC